MGFGQEIKDFLGAAEKTYKTLDDVEYNKMKKKYLQAQIDNLDDPEGDALDLEGKRLKNEALKASTRLTGQRGSLINARIKALNNPGTGAIPTALPIKPGAAGISTNRPMMPPAVGPQSSIDGSFNTASLEDDDSDDMGGTNFASRGGKIQHFAEGGMVDDAADEEDSIDDGADIAQPAIGGAPQQDTDFSSAGRRPSYSVDASHDAVNAGLKYGVQQYGLNQGAAVMTPARQRALNAYTRGQDAATPQEMEAIYKKIDPDNKLTDSERNISALGAIWQYKMSKNDTLGAQKAAFQMLQHMRVASQRYAAISAAAVEHGDVPGAVKAAVKSYSSIPDGRDLKVTQTPDGQLQYSIVDQQTGKVVNGGIASPEQLAAQAMNVATKGFDQFLLDSAGQKAAKGQKKGAIGGGGMKPRDRDTVLTQLDTAFDKVAPKDEGTGKSVVPPAEEEAARGGAYRMLSDSRNNITPAEAATIALNLAREPKDSKKSDFTVKRVEDDAGGGYQVKLGNKPPVFMAENDFDALVAMRAEKAAKRKAETEKADKGGRGLLSEAGDAASRYVNDPAIPEQAFPGGSSRAPADEAPAEAIPTTRSKPYVPFMAGGKKTATNE